MSRIWETQRRAAVRAGEVEILWEKGDAEKEILRCPVCGEEISAEERLLWQNGCVQACPACMARQGFAWRALL